MEVMHSALTYPLYARQLPEQLATGAWLAMEARISGEVAGLILWSQGRKRAELLSIAVASRFRRRGVASHLLEAACAHVRESGLSYLSTTFRDDLANAAAVRALLKRNGWSEPTALSESGRSDSDEVAERVLRFTEKVPVPPTVRVVAWGETVAAQRDLLVVSPEVEPWFPAELAPARFCARPFFEETVSSALLHEGAIIGWTLILVVPGARPKADFSCAYVHPRWQRRGAFLWMLARSIARLRERYPDFSSMFTVSVQRPETQRFVRKRLGPLGVEFASVLFSTAPGLGGAASG